MVFSIDGLSFVGGLLFPRDGEMILKDPLKAPRTFTKTHFQNVVKPLLFVLSVKQVE